MAAFDIPYAIRPGYGCRPAADDTLTIAPFAAALHLVRRQLRRLQDGAQVDRHDQVVALHRQLQVAGKGDRGVVDQNVEAAEVIDGAAHHALDLGLDGQVGRHRQAAPARRLDLAHRVVDRSRQLERRIVGGARRAGDVDARLSQRDRHRAPDAAARTGDQRDATVQLHRRVF